MRYPFHLPVSMYLLLTSSPVIGSYTMQHPTFTIHHHLRRFFFICSSFLLLSCHHYMRISTPVRTSFTTGSEFYQRAAPMNWQQRDSLVVREILSGNLPAFLKKFVPIHVSMKDS